MMPPFNMQRSELAAQHNNICLNRRASAVGRGHDQVIVPIDEEEELLHEYHTIAPSGTGHANKIVVGTDQNQEKSESAVQAAAAADESKIYKNAPDHHSQAAAAIPVPSSAFASALNVASAVPSTSSTPIKSANSSNIFSKKNRKSKVLPPNMWRSTGPGYVTLAPDQTSDPPTKLIENFLQRQAASGNWCLDMDMDMMDKLPQVLANDDALTTSSCIEVNNPNYTNLNLIDAQPIGPASASVMSKSSSTKPIPDAQPSSRTVVQHAVSSKPAQVSEASQINYGTPPASTRPGPAISSDSQPCPATAGDNIRAADTFAEYHDNDDEEEEEDDSYYSSADDDEAHHRTKSVLTSLMRIQTRSRLADPPPNVMQSNGAYKSAQLRSGPVRSGMIQKSGFMGKLDAAEEEDDPLKDVDMPDSFRGHRCSPLIVFEWVFFFLVMAALVCSLTVPALKQRPLWSMALWKWALLVFLLFSGRLVSGWIIRILVVILERNFLLRKRVLYFVYGLRKGVQNFLWFAFTVLAWRLVFDPKLDKATNTKVLPVVTKILNCLLIGAAIWLVKIFFVKVLASSFHVSTYFERIRESLFGQWLLETLSGPPLVEMQEEANLIEEIDGLRKAGAAIPESMIPKARLGGDIVANAVENKGYTHMYTMNRGGKGMNRTRTGVGKSGVIGLGRSGMLGVGKSGMIGGVGRSGMIGRSGMLQRMKSQHNFNMDKMQVPEETITIDDLQRLNRRNISAWNMKRMMNFVRYRGVCTLAQVIDQGNAVDESQDVEIESEWQARSAARNIFKNVAKPRSRFIVKDDLLRFMREPEVEKAMALFEGAMETGKITKSALKEFAVHVVRERKALSLSLNDTKTAVKKLHRLVDVVVGVAITIISLLVLGIATTQLLLLVSSQLVLVVFIFGNTCKNVFEAIVFLFVMHPFDVGDRCVIDGNQVVVEEMNILSTVFMRNDGEKLWYPNSLLATKYIFNYHCTPDMGDSFEFCIDCSTPADKISALKDRIARYIAGKASHWSRDFNLVVQGIEDNSKMKMQLQVNHTINYNVPTERQVRRSELILEVQRMLQEMGFAYHLPLQEVRLHNVVPPSASDHLRRRQYNGSKDETSLQHSN